MGLFTSRASSKRAPSVKAVRPSPKSAAQSPHNGHAACTSRYHSSRTGVDVRSPQFSQTSVGMMPDCQGQRTKSPRCLAGCGQLARQVVEHGSSRSPVGAADRDVGRSCRLSTNSISTDTANVPGAVASGRDLGSLMVSAASQTPRGLCRCARATPRRLANDRQQPRGRRGPRTGSSSRL